MPDKMSQGEDRPAARLRRRGRRRADRRRRRTRRSPTTASPTGWPRRSPAPSSPTSTSTRPTRRPTTRRPAPRSGSRPAARSPTSSSASAPAARSPAPARYLKERNPDLVVIGADPVGSIYSGGEDDVTPVPRRGRRRGLLARDVRPVDRRPLGHASRDRDSFLTTRRLAQAEGILAGGSGGLAVARGARGRARDRRPRRAGRRHPARRRALLPVEDLQRRLDDAVRLPRARRPTRPSATCCARKSDARRDPAARHRRRPHQHVRDAVALLHEHRVSQLPVVSAHDPRTVVGSIGERGLLAPRGRGRGAARRRDRRRHGAAVPGGRGRRPGARGGRAARRRPPGAARHRRRPRRRASSRAPTCWKRWPDEPPTASASPPAPSTPA